MADELVELSCLTAGDGHEKMGKLISSEEGKLLTQKCWATFSQWSSINVCLWESQEPLMAEFRLKGSNVLFNSMKSNGLE